MFVCHPLVYAVVEIQKTAKDKNWLAPETFTIYRFMKFYRFLFSYFLVFANKKHIIKYWNISVCHDLKQYNHHNMSNDINSTYYIQHVKCICDSIGVSQDISLDSSPNTFPIKESIKKLQFQKH
ncbi:hypothetical protein BpHYR1_050393 [Brachionus plicatilis]|uniref:Uncharacterized protein n=1 Tax=Brachionus plicatilis TaxID=10195 RepID=A0A3M7SBN4_BRAPC|nr:hypothetical protein BpHYR1_050393 [Brachionus plicatilis]